MDLFSTIVKKTLEIRSKIPTDSRQLSPYETQFIELRKLLKKAQDTAFGEEYQFKRLLSSKANMINEFQDSVPVHDYNSIYKRWWYRLLNGESFVTWPGRVRYFALSSGTSEASSKQIPVSAAMIRAIKKTSVRQMISLVYYDFPKEFFNKGILMLGGSTHLHYNGTYYEGDLSGISTKNVPFWFQHFYKPGKRIAKERDWQTKLDEIVRKAKDWDIGVICGVPAWQQILMERIIEHYKVKTIHDIWPNLSVYAWGGVSLEPYKKGFEKLVSRPLTYMETYLASEGFIAYQSRPDTNSLKLVLDNGLFYEFVPFNENNFDSDGNLIANPKTLLVNEVELNKDYAILLTTCAGAWRYLIGDTIKFTNLCTPEIQITGRTKHFMNLCGEHLSQENMNRAIRMLEDELNIDVREFTLTGIQYQSMFAHKWYLGCDDPIDPEMAARKIDSYLKILNDDYRVERIAAIRNVVAEVQPLNIFYDFMKKKGKEGGQHKFPRVLKGNILQEWTDFLNNNNKTNP